MTASSRFLSAAAASPRRRSSPRWLGAVVLALLQAGCGAGGGADGASPTTAAPSSAAPAADLVVVNAAVHTADRDRPRATAFAVRDGRFVRVGEEAAVRALAGPATRIVDAGGAAVLPGFVDAHTHLAGGGDLISGVDLFDLPRKAQWLERIAAHVATLAPGEWVLGGRWDYTLAEGEYPTRADLDAVAPRNPVALGDIDGHSLWLNSLALELAGIRAGSPVPAGGEIVLDARDGEPTGILKEAAMGLVAGAPGYRAAVDATYELLAQTAAHANSLGITAVHDMAGADTLARWHALAADDSLTLRVWYGMTGVREPGRAAALAAERARWRVVSPTRGPLLALGYLKYMADGVLSTHTAWLIEPYADRPDWVGEPFFDPATLQRFVREGNAAGFPVAVHAIGDAAVRAALDAFEAAGDRRLWNRIEHIELVTPADVARFAPLHVAASMQPNHATGVIGKYITERIGEDRETNAYVWASLLHSGATLALGTDWPTAPLSPLTQLTDAVLRESPYGLHDGPWHAEQALAFDEALRAYTAAATALTDWGGEVGMIREGWWADFVVLDAALAEPPGRDLRARRVLQTWLAGDQVYQADDGVAHAPAYGVMGDVSRAAPAAGGPAPAARSGSVARGIRSSAR